MEDLVLESGFKKGITFSAGGLKEIKRLLTEQTTSDKVLRIGVKGGGCAGFTYILEFDGQKEADLIFEINGIKVIIDPTHLLYLEGTEIDFQQGLNSRGFVYKNPNASKTCGCGESFG